MSENNEKKTLSKPLQLILLICFGVILILIAILIGKSYPAETNPSIATGADLLKSLGESLIIGPALSWILDLESMVNYFRKITVESLVSSDYLKSLPRQKLVELRKECTAKIHLKDENTVEKGLINMDESVCELLTKPYYERYRQNTTSKTEDDRFVNKHHIEEYIINPMGNRVTFDDLPRTFLNLRDGEDVRDIVHIVKFTVKIDDAPEVDYTDSILLKASKIEQNDTHYNHEVTWVNKQTNEVFKIDYTRSLIINRVFVVKTPKTDITFIKRVKMPVKSFLVDYYYMGDDLRLVGSCFGTLSYANDGGIHIIQEPNYISIESFNWILPGNGIFIVKVNR